MKPDFCRQRILRGRARACVLRIAGRFRARASGPGVVVKPVNFVSRVEWLERPRAFREIRPGFYYLTGGGA